VVRRDRLAHALEVAIVVVMLTDRRARAPHQHLDRLAIDTVVSEPRVEASAERVEVERVLVEVARRELRRRAIIDGRRSLKSAATCKPLEDSNLPSLRARRCGRDAGASDFAT
jgi:hypothetical protein